VLPGILVAAALYSLAESAEYKTVEHADAAFFLRVVERTKHASFHYSTRANVKGDVTRDEGQWQPGDGDSTPVLFAFDNIQPGNGLEVRGNVYRLIPVGGGGAYFDFEVNRGYVTHIAQRVPRSTSFDVWLSDFRG
jgi:hypothetical protein